MKITILKELEMIRQNKYLSLTKNVLLVGTLSLLLLGCSDKEEKKAETKVSQSKAGAIEVTQSKDTYAKKTEEKDKSKDKTYYYSYSEKEKENSFTKEAKSYTKFDANMRVRTPYEKVRISLLVKSLSKDFIVKCSACHNDYANGIIGPSLLDKDEKSIFTSIMSFRNDEKKNILMSELVKNMSEKEIKEIAVEIAKFNKKVNELK